MKLQLGDSVIVKQGVKEPDLQEFEIGGWQGRVIRINSKSDKDNILITIEWDSQTLLQIPSNYIEQSERDGLEWKCMVLFESELEKAIPRDDITNVRQTQEKLSDIHYWDSLGDEGIRISKVLNNVNPLNEMECFQKWMGYLNNALSFPISAIVTDDADNGSIESGEMITINSLSRINDIYGIIASISHHGKKYEFPLCDLKATDKAKAEFQMIDDYRIWFANR